MKAEDIEIGMKVVPIKKSVYNPLSTSSVWKEAKRIHQPFLYITKIQNYPDKCEVILNETMESNGDFFLAEDFEPYIETRHFNIAIDETRYEEWKKAAMSIIPQIIATNIPQIKQIIFNPPATIVIWTDGTQTVVKVGEGSKFDEETGVAACLTKKIYGSYSKFKKEIKNKTLK